MQFPEVKLLRSNEVSWIGMITGHGSMIRDCEILIFQNGTSTWGGRRKLPYAH
jgi:hypothetical protein